MGHRRILGIDTGGTMAKAALFDLDGTEVASSRSPNAVSFPAPGHTEVDPEQFWLAACRAARGVLDASGTAPRDVVAVSTTGHGNGLHAVDAEARPIGFGVISTDSRAADVGTDWEAAGHGEAARAAIMQRFWPGQTLPLLGWFVRHRPAALERAAAIFGSKDYIRARLTGELSTDPTEAAVSGLLDFRTGGYASALFERLGLEAVMPKLPPIRPSLEVAAAVSAEGAAATGLREGTPVVRGLTDVVACAVGSGVGTTDTMSVIAGTFSINQTLHREPRRSVVPVLQIPYPIGGLHLAAECAATSAGNLEWLCRTVLGAEAARATASGRSIYDLCGQWVDTALERPGGALFLPFLFGGPGGAPAGFVGLRASHDLADVVRAVFEGIAFAHRMDVSKLTTGADAATPRLARLAGGASRSTVWPQVFADVLRMDFEVAEGSELGAKGVAMAAAVALGHRPSLEGAMDGMVRVARCYRPDPARADLYDTQFARFEAVARALARVDQH